MADEVLSRPPSHPIASTLLILSCIGTIGCIGFVWAELFNEYMPAKGANSQIEALLQKHGPVAIANGRRDEDVDHYKIDFGAGDMIEAIDKKLLGNDESIEEPSNPTPPPSDGGGGDEGGGDGDGE
ncbi:MAG: hypothetical protein KDD82_23840 [Planctomycetes bacterium]|nr:hypothetical protein [Planctomycetota bacterium]